MYECAKVTFSLPFCFQANCPWANKCIYYKSDTSQNVAFQDKHI